MELFEIQDTFLGIMPGLPYFCPQEIAPLVHVFPTICLEEILFDCVAPLQMLQE